MIKNFLIAAALVIASPALVFSQDLFISFDRASNVTTTTGNVSTSGTFTIFGDQPFAFDALDLDVTSSDTSVLLLTGGTAFNGEYVGNPFITGPAFNSTNLTLTPDGSGNVNGDIANLFAANITENGIIPAGSDFYTEFETGPGSGNGAFVLAEVTYDIVGMGNADLTLSLGTQGALALPDNVLNPSFGNASLTGVGGAVVPEPSSATLLVLGAVGMFARRRRARA